MKRCSPASHSVGGSLPGPHFIHSACRGRRECLRAIAGVVSVVMILGVSAFAGTANIFGKVTDTATGGSLDSVIIKLSRTTAA